MPCFPTFAIAVTLRKASLGRADRVQHRPKSEVKMKGKDTILEWRQLQVKAPFEPPIRELTVGNNLSSQEGHYLFAESPEITTFQ